MATKLFSSSRANLPIILGYASYVQQKKTINCGSMNLVSKF